MKRIIRKKFRKFWKSAINRRLAKYTSRFSVVVFMLAIILSFGKIQGTNSFFTDTATVAGNTMTAGYWVPPTISFIGSVGGEDWQVGSSKNITWNATSADPAATGSMKIDIDYSCDGGANWHSIASNITNSGTKSWTVPSDVSDHCKIKIGATDSHGLTNSVESNEFEISYMVVLNEFVPYPASSSLEFVEIYNYGTENINVNGWRITDDHGPDTNKRMIDSAHTNTGSTIVGPGTSRFLVIENYDDFYLNNTGSDEARLYDVNKKLIDSHSYSNPLQGKSFARNPDGVGNWVDPVPTPGEKNTSSNDEKDFQKYYREVCFDKNGKPRCDLKFLKSIGLIDDKIQLVKPVVAEDVPSEPVAVDTASPSQTDAPAPVVALVSDLGIVNGNVSSLDQPASGDVTPPIVEPKIISKDFGIDLKGKLVVPDGFLADTEQKMKKLKFSGEGKVINDLKDFEIDIAKVKIDKVGKIEITVGDLDLPKDADLVDAKKDDVVALITVTEKPKDDPKKDEKVSANPDATVPAKDEIKVEEKKDASGAGADPNNNNPVTP